MVKFPGLLKHRGASRGGTQRILHIVSSPFKRKTPYEGISMIRTETHFDIGYTNVAQIRMTLLRRSDQT